MGIEEVEKDGEKRLLNTQTDTKDDTIYMHLSMRVFLFLWVCVEIIATGKLNK